MPVTNYFDVHTYTDTYIHTYAHKYIHVYIHTYFHVLSLIFSEISFANTILIYNITLNLQMTL